MSVDSFRYLTPAQDRTDRPERLQLWSAIEQVTSLSRPRRTEQRAGISIYD